MENQENINVDEVEVETTETENKEVETKEKLFSQDEVNDIINKKFAQWKKKEEEAKKQAEELAKLSEQDKAKKLLEIKEKELEEREKALENEKLLNETTKQLAAKNLPIEFAELLKGNDAESTFNNIKIFEEKFNKALEIQVVERLKGNAPKANIKDSSKVSAITKEDFKKMNMAQRIKLRNDNPTLYEELSE